MPQITIDEINWRITRTARMLQAPFRSDDLMDHEAFQASKQALKELIVEYINSDGHCHEKMGDTVSPMGAAPDGGKAYKIRWALPGGGRSGGLRIAIVMFCATKTVEVRGMWSRRDKPSNADFDAAFKDGGL